MDFELKQIIEFLGEQNVSSVQEIQKKFYFKFYFLLVCDFKPKIFI